MKADPVVRVRMVIGINLEEGMLTSCWLYRLDGDAEGLHRAEDHGEIALHIANFLAAHLAFFLQLGEAAHKQR